MATCSSCGGSGKVMDQTCSACGGLGYFEGGKAADDFIHGRSNKKGCAVLFCFLSAGALSLIGVAAHLA